MTNVRVPDRVVAAVAGIDRFPAYVYDLEGLRAHAAAIRAALGGRAELLYAAKANPDPRVLATLAPYVDGFEVSSGGELRHVRAVVPGAPLTFGGPGKTPEELREAVRTGLRRVHVESPREMERLVAAVRAGGGRRGVDVLLRVNLPAELPGVALTMGGTATPFGMDPDTLDRCARMAAGTPEVRVRGVHAHLASGLDAAAMVGLAEHVLTWARSWCAAHRVRRPEINLGGGMAVDYGRPERRFAWREYAAGLARLATGPGALPGERLRVEPGRAVTAYCGWYVTEVLDVKHTHGEWFAVLRGGTHHLRTPVTKGHDQPFAVLPGAGRAEAAAVAGGDGGRGAERALGRMDGPTGGRADGRTPENAAGRAGEHAGEGHAGEEVVDAPVTLVGQLCTPKDVFARRRRVDRLAPGDVVAFAMAGAYAWNISHHDFLMHPHPGFHYVEAAPPGGG